MARAATTLATAVVGVACLLAACGPQGAYFRGGDAGTGLGGTGGESTDGVGGNGTTGTGGSLGGTGGTSGGASGGSGAAGAGGGGFGGTTLGSGGSATGGSGSGGRVMGSGGTGGSAAGAPGSGGAATGGQAGAGSAAGATGSGGQGTGGAGSGGQGTGGAGSGGQGTGGAGSGGQGTGGAATGGAGPHIISIDFVGGSTSAGGAGGSVLVSGTPMTAGESAGVRPAANWNSAPGATGSLPTLALSDGTPTSASVTWTSPGMGTSPGIWRIGYLDAPGDTRMMNGYLDPVQAAMPATIVVSGLPSTITTGGFAIYVYVGGNVQTGQTRTYRYAIGTSSVTVSQSGPTPTTFPGYTLAPSGGAGNYIVFSNLTGSTFTLTATPGTGTQTRAPVNGIQIVSSTGS